MKKMFFIAALMATSVTVQAQIVPAPSPLARVSQMVGLTEIELEYSRPALNERRVFTEKFVPLGELWRTGANRASKITFSHDVVVGGTPVSAGSYAIFTIPGEKKVQFILNSNANQGGTGSYDEALNVMSTEVRVEETRETVERMRFSIENMTDSEASLVWEWDIHRFSVPIEIKTQEIAKGKIEEKLKEMDGQYSFYNEAARYYLDSNLDNKLALDWALKSVQMNERFWNVHTLAKAYHANGDKKNAMKYAEMSMKMSREADYQPYVVMNEELIAKINGGK